MSGAEGSRASSEVYLSVNLLKNLSIMPLGVFLVLVVYEGHSFNVVIGILQGALLIPFAFCLLQPFEVFSLDGNTHFKSGNLVCKGREVGLFRYTLKTLVKCTTKCTSGFIMTTKRGSKGNRKKLQVWRIRWMRELNYLFLFQEVLDKNTLVSMCVVMDKTQIS